MRKAYAANSGFHVGAAVMLENGAIVLGNNQENIAYPSGLCAERVALNSAKAEYPDVDVTHLAVVGAVKNGDSFDPITPCGGCCQVIDQVEQRNSNEKKIKIIMASTRGNIFEVTGSKKLLPFAFRENFLTK